MTAVLPPLVAAAAAGEERTTTETSAPQAGSEAQAGTVPGYNNVVMVPVDQSVPSPPLAKESEVMAPEEPETLEAMATPPSGSAGDMPRYLSIPGIGIIDLDTTELPSNAREILGTVTECVFTDPSILEAEIREDAAPVTAAPTDAGASSSTVLAPDAVTSE